MSDELQQKILQWLAGEGYTLEMRVARIFNRRKWETSQSVVYQGDAKPREIDVLAMKRVGLPQKDGEIWRAFEFVVVTECKSQVSKPWVVFTTEATAGPSIFNIDSRAANRFGSRFLDALATGELFEPIPFFKVEERTGYAAVRAFESGNLDGAYAAISAVVDATSHWCKFSSNEHTARCRIVFPVIVTPAPLFEAFLDEENKERVARRDSITLFAENQVLGGQYAVIEIVNESALAAYVEKLEGLFDYIWGKYQNEVAAAFGDHPLAKKN